MKGAIWFRDTGNDGDPVSIHAPVKGAMVDTVHIAFEEPVSIHAPVKGAMATADKLVKTVEFQSTHP